MGNARRVAASGESEILHLFTFSIDGRSMELARPLELQVAFEEGMYFVENDLLRLFGNGVSLSEAVQAFERDLAYYWRYYNALSEEEVEGAGLALKRVYDGLVTA
jgi:hypothetical protein